MINLYSTGCPKCTVLKKKLDSKNIKYNLIMDYDVMVAKHIDAVPVLEVDNKLLSFVEANNWINNIEG